jgi:hypothetical protein
MSTPKHVKAKFGNRVEITVDANIAGRSFIVDGTPYSSTQVFTWTQFLTHTLSINSPQPGGTGERFVFTSWSHGQTQNHTYTVPGSDQTLTANFKRQYYLTLNSPHGSLQGGNVYCDENTWINFSVTTPDQQGNTRYVFLEWTGHYTGDEPSGWIYMDSPKTVTAVWNTQHYLHVVSFHGNPTGDGWYNAGEPAPFGITTPASGETGIQYIFLEWSGTGSGSYSGTNTNPTVNMNNPIKETADWKTQFFLTTSENPAEYGNITPLPPGVWRDSSDVQSISAAPETGYHFARWDGDLAGTQNPIDLTIDAPKSVTAFFGEQVQITVKTSPTRLAFYVDGVYYNYTKNFNDWIENSYHILYTHYEQPGSSGIRYLFLRWSNYLPQSHTYTVPGYNQVVTAYFKTQYRLQVNSEHGNPTPSEPTWHDGGTEAYFSVNSSEEYGDTRYNFWKWSGDYTGMDTSGHVTMTSPKSVTALWNYQYKLTINSPYGEVHIENDGWYNENDTAYFYITSQEVDDSTRHVFIEWIGDYTGTDTSGAIVMDSPKTITTNWRKEYYLYIHENPDEGGDVLPGPPGQWCDNGSQIQVVAAPNRAEDYIFGGWTGDEVSIDSSIIITMDRSKGVTANFLLLGKIRITTNPVGLQIVVDDSLKISPADFTWPSDSRHTIGAISPQSEINGSRYVFDSWNDTGPISHEITVNGISIYTASFIKQYHLSSQSDPTEGGTVIHSPPGSWLDDESVVTLEAVPDSIAGFIFWKWGGDLTGKNNPESVVMDTSKQIIASFISGTCSLEVLIQPLGSGTVTSNPVKELFKRGEFVELTAIPEEGYSFKDWTGDTISTNNPITIQLNTNKYLIANFIDETEGFPLLVDCCPPHGAKEIPKNAHIQFSVVDQNNSSGIDRSSIDVSVDNVDIILNGMIQEGCQVELMGRRSGYTIRYQPNENFIEDSQIVVHVRCQDLSLYQNEVDSTYTFSIGQSPVIVTKEQMIDQAGGTIIDDLTGIEIEIPAGAVEDTTYITIGYYQNPPPLPDSVRYVDMAYHFGPEGFQFADSALLRITYYPSDLANAGVTNPYDLPVYYYSTSSGHWIRLNILYASSYYVEVKVKEFCYLLFGEKEITSIEGNQDNLPRAYALKQNYPNPFNASTTIDYAVPEQSHIRLAVYNVRGECIYELITGQCDPGTYQVHFDASELGSGLYFYRMDAKSNSSNEIYGYVRKMIILK